MCMCTPSIKSIYCLKCMPVPSGFRPMDYDGDDLIQSPLEEVKAIIKSMDGLSEDGFNNRYLNDPSFNKGIRVLMDMVSRR